MAKINQDLISQSRHKLGIDEKSVYPRIQRVVNETGLERHLAAILYAMRNGINVNRFSNKDERVDVSTSLGAATAINHRRRDPDDAPQLPPAPSGRKSAARKSADAPRARRSLLSTAATKRCAHRCSTSSEPLQSWSRSGDEAIRRAAGAPTRSSATSSTASWSRRRPCWCCSLRRPGATSGTVRRPGQKNTEGKLLGQARPNVIFEAGLAMGRHQEKTVFVQVGRLKPFSDIGGRRTSMRFNGSPESRNALVGRLEMLHCDLDTGGRDWLRVGSSNRHRRRRRPSDEGGLDPGYAAASYFEILHRFADAADENGEEGKQEL